MDGALPPLPKTLLEWRNWNARHHAKDMASMIFWNHLEDFFKQQGFILWKRANRFYPFGQVPPNANPRCPDGYAFRLPSSDAPEVHRGMFQSTTGTLCAARTLDDRDVVIRLIVKGEDGFNHLEALKRLSTGYIGSRGENHTIPVFKLLCLEDMIFAVSPFMAALYFDHPWYCTIAELYDAMEQVLEGVAFMHENLVAHLDLDTDNILTNFSGGPLVTPPGERTPFRALFPARYYIHDLELAVCFDKDSDPATRLISGLPTHRLGHVGEYARDVAPEFLLDKSYCPFKADIWQVGNMFHHFCDQVSAIPNELKNLFLLMANDTPSARPSASEALLTFRGIRRTTSIETLLEEPEEPLPRWIPDDPIVDMPGLSLTTE